MALLSVKDACIDYDGFLLLDHINLNIERHERVCLLGRNGSGKTTLMKLINGEITPDSGAVSRSQGITTARLDQEIPAGIAGPVIDIVTSGLAAKGRLLADYHHASALLADQRGDAPRLLARLDRLGQQLDAENGWEIHRQVDLIIARMQLPAEAEFTTLSTGLKRRTLLAQALVAGPDILMLDEPTNHLDIDAITWLEDFLAAYGGTIVIVTHDRLLVQKLAGRIIEIDRGRLLDWPCDYATFLTRKEESLAMEASQNQLFDKKLSIEEAWLRQGVKARRTRDQGRVNTLLKLRARRRQRQELPGGVKMSLQAGKRSGDLVIAAENISYQYPGKQVIRDFSTAILRQDRVGIIGPNGCGKTTLLRLLLGELTPAAGPHPPGHQPGGHLFRSIARPTRRGENGFRQRGRRQRHGDHERCGPACDRIPAEISLHAGAGANQGEVPFRRGALPPAAGAFVHPGRQCSGPGRAHE